MSTTSAKGRIRGRNDASGLFERRSLIIGRTNIIERPNQIIVTRIWIMRAFSLKPAGPAGKSSSRDLPSALKDVVIAVSALITDAINDMFFSIELRAFFVLIIL